MGGRLDDREERKRHEVMDPDEKQDGKHRMKHSEAARADLNTVSP